MICTCIFFYLSVFYALASMINIHESLPGYEGLVSVLHYLLPVGQYGGTQCRKCVRFSKQFGELAYNTVEEGYIMFGKVATVTKIGIQILKWR